MKNSIINCLNIKKRDLSLMIKGFKFFTFVFIFLTGLSIKSQIINRTDSIKENIIVNFTQDTSFHSNEKTWCETYIEIASRMCVNDSIVLPYYFPSVAPVDINTKTCFELLKREYGFMEFDIVRGDYIPSFIYCFEKYMIEYVESQLGDEFFKDIKKEADSLDYLGLGYIEAEPFDKTFSFEQFFKDNLKSYDKLFNDEDLVRVLSFKVLANGQIFNTRVRVGYYGQKLIKDDVFGKEILSLIKKMPKWSPAKYRGNSVSSEVVYFIR